MTRKVAELDAKGLRALAHPLRLRMVGLLRRHGPSTATRLAERLGINSGAASYHLRTLAAAGFVAEDTERGNARERWWTAVHDADRFSDHALAEREPETALAYLQAVHAHYNLRIQQALDELQTLPPQWRSAFDMSSYSLRLTPEEAERLHADLLDLVGRYRKDGSEPAPAGAQRISLLTHLLPEVES